MSKTMNAIIQAEHEFDHVETLVEFFKIPAKIGKHAADRDYAKFRAEHIAYVQNGRRITGGFGKHRHLRFSERYSSAYKVVERAA